MAEAKSPRKKTSTAKPTAASATRTPAAKKAAPARAASAKAAPAKAAPAKAAARPSAKAATTRVKPTLTRAEIEERKEKKKNAALRVAKKASGPRPGTKAATAKAAPAKATAAKAAPAKATAAKSTAAKKTPKADAAPKPKPRKRPELSASTPDAAALRRDGARELAKLIATAGIDKKAERIEILDIGEKVDYADFLVLMSGRSDRQVRSVADGVIDSLKEKGHRPTSVEGMQQGQWVLVDYSDVIVHVFVDEARRYYDIEGLWMDATRVPFEGSSHADGASATGQ